MAQVLYPTAIKVEGPLLIEKDSLTRLDSILDDHWKRFVENQDQEFEKEFDLESQRWAKLLNKEEMEERRSSLDRSIRSYGKYFRQRSVTIHFADGRKLRVQSFSEALSNVEIIDELPVDLKVKMICGNVEMSIETETYTLPTLTLSVSPSDDETARDLFGDLKSWLRTVRPSKWLKLWSWISVFSLGLWMSWFVCLSLFLVNSVSNSVDYKSIGSQIVAKGVTSENRDQALQVILAIQSGYGGSTTFHPGLRMWIFALGGFVACLILSYSPKIVIGLGKGEQRISAWRTWIKIVFVFIPLFIASNILAPLLVDLISRKLG
jgi:hypothetical protein